MIDQELANLSARYLTTKWVPKNRSRGGLHWKVTDVAISLRGRCIIQLEKYQGGRNSPAIMTTKRLRRNFVQVQ